MSATAELSRDDDSVDLSDEEQDELFEFEEEEQGETEQQDDRDVAAANRFQALKNSLPLSNVTVRRRRSSKVLGIAISPPTPRMEDILSEPIISSRSGSPVLLRMSPVASPSFLQEQTAVQQWIEERLNVKIGDKSLFEALKDGVMLCHLARSFNEKLIPLSEIRVPSPDIPYGDHVQMSDFNILKFSQACSDLGVPDECRFQFNDLYLKGNLQQVLRCLRTLQRQAKAVSWDLAKTPPPAVSSGSRLSTRALYPSISSDYVEEIHSPQPSPQQQQQQQQVSPLPAEISTTPTTIENEPQLVQQPQERQGLGAFISNQAGISIVLGDFTIHSILMLIFPLILLYALFFARFFQKRKPKHSVPRPPSSSSSSSN